MRVNYLRIQRQGIPGDMFILIKKRKEKKSKCSHDPCLQCLNDFSAVVSLTQSIIATNSSILQSLWLWVKVKVIQLVSKCKVWSFLSSCQVWKNRFTSVQTVANVKKVHSMKSPENSSVPWMSIVRNRFSLSFSEPISHYRIPTFIQIDWVCEKLRAKFFDFSHNCDLE